jgi:hypothetical protein
VRVEAGRLRRALARYYGGAGSNDPVVIELPRGSYVPTFHARANAASTTSDANPATLRGNPGSAELAAVLAGLMDLRQQQVNAMAAEVESERRMLELVRELLAAVGVDACRTAPPLPNAISTGEPARGPRQSEIPPHSPCRHCPDRQP